ncbi:SWI/SNF and RSC complexes subunit ssr3-like [Syzygium oleosum]|uniref:SWI/SNF and RSC complexes subunit ssr3-like n=1 Tax=Syzygium oleosum TaxID=219896 RepID=UPI0024B95924|nr:SWI/SNF and RSC complexes subunit ssr3-like [Syzygium oleosum]XP_056163559.1 SWI/SNF and RSC complexes subunit ssr3-like [Syzygium oleosum]XP_056163560.1 SWI/SNF and RSC complexes subunit ssr3-like [Syzygium oleosum]
MAVSLSSLSSILARESASLAGGAAATSALPSSSSSRLALPSRRAAALAATVRAVSSPSSSPAAGKREPRGIMKPRPVSPEMQAVVGAPEIPRTQALKQIWAYIKENNLQDPENKKIIICDEKLKKIFGGKDRVGFLEIAGLISPHFL